MTLLPARLARAIEHYLDTKDAPKSALMAGMDPEDFAKALKEPDIEAEVQKRQEVIDRAYAETLAAARGVNVHFLDKHLAKAVENGAAKGDTKALELGYERVGMRRDDNFIVTERKPTDERAQPQIYRVLEQTQTLTVTQREVTAGDGLSQMRLPRAVAAADIEEY